jgi:protoporphyrinogen oxidase
MSRPTRTAVIGGGVTGLAAGVTSGATVFEQSGGPGGICRSYYVRPGTDEPLADSADVEDAYRFEVGGGHWIFGGDADSISLLEHLAPLRTYTRAAAVRLGSLGRTVPYPLQGHVEQLGTDLAERAAREVAEQPPMAEDSPTLSAWLEHSFGPSLCRLFFFPFHDRYTAGLTGSIAPQDGYKTPPVGGRGYNATFRYPIGGLDRVAAGLGAQCDIRFDKRVVGIATEERTLQFSDGSEHGYDRLLSTLPIHSALAAARLAVDDAPDPYTSALVLNLAGERGPACPDAHWQYEPDSASGFHRIGFYSNVEPDFLPVSRRSGTHVSMYVERAFPGRPHDNPHGPPPDVDVAGYTAAVIAELQDRGYLGRVEAVHPSWVDVAYTWRTPGSHWRGHALAALAGAGVEQVGRYARWHFQGIADSIRDGAVAGRSPLP